MTFQNAEFLILLWLLPGVIGLMVWGGRVRVRRYDRLGDRALVARLISSLDRRRRRIKNGLWLIAVGAGIIALARPAWGIAEQVVAAEGLSIIVVLDVSTSMDAQDIAPSRLERAKLAARELFLGARGNQVGLVLFAGGAFVQLPMTTDSTAAVTFLNAASTNAVSSQGTALEDALELAVASFDERLASNGIIVVLSDGENHEGVPLNAAEDAMAKGIVIHAIGYGDPVNGQPIPLLNPDGSFANGYKTDSAGQLVLTRLEESVLMSVAESTGGTYQRASENGIDIVNLLNVLAELDTDIIERRRQLRRTERFGWFIAIAVAALSAEIFMSERREEVKRDAQV